MRFLLYPAGTSVMLTMIAVIHAPLDARAAGTRYHDEAYRPQFHFTADKGWLNDPNGLVFYDGEYHLFYQHNPESTNPLQEKSWGHAVSTDLLHWRYLPVAVPPTPRPGKRAAGAWSGSGVVDWKNTAGFQTGSEKPIVLAWTAVAIGQCLAYSNDRGRTFTPYAGNPVVPAESASENDPDRDPKVFWYAPAGEWIMVFSVTGKGVKFYSSPDLKKWTYRSLYPGLWECPDMYELAVDGESDQKKWAIQDASGKYFIGRFDGKSFQRESGPFILDDGRNYYAAQSWSDVPDGRRISIAWMRGGAFPGMPFNQQLSIPCVLALKTLPEGLRVTRQPVKEVGSLRTDGRHWENRVLKPGENLLKGIEGDTFDVVADIEMGTAKRVGFRVRGEAVEYDGEALTCMGKSVPLKAAGGRVRLRVLVDRTSLEVFGNGGAVSMTSSLPPAAVEKKGLEIYAVGGEAGLVSLDVYRMRSVWAK